MRYKITMKHGGITIKVIVTGSNRQAVENWLHASDFPDQYKIYCSPVEIVKVSEISR